VTVSRYIVIVAAVYIFALIAVLAALGEMSVLAPRSLLHYWVLWPGGVALAVIGTMGPIARFGAVGGSLYFLPTVLHVSVLVSLVLVVWSVA
jgi:hypothetical protein